MTNVLEDIKQKVFKSGNPVFLYIAINVALFIVTALLGVIFTFAGQKGLISGLVSEYLAFPSAPNLWLSHLYTIITYQFFHADVFHILFNMIWLFWMGQLFMDFVKPRQFHFVYLTGGIIGVLFFALIYNLVPYYANQNATIIGSSAAVSAILVACATLVPNYTIRLMFLGNVKIKFLVLAFILLDILGTTGTNAGGSLAHLGGALFGFVYIKLLQNGTDLSSIFKKKPKLKVVKNDTYKSSNSSVNQKEIDAILDKISQSGYDKLSKEEKETLFKASKS